MKSDWQQLPFEEVLEDCSGGNPKVLQSSYQVSGKIAVVDQGQDLIAGYVDDSAFMCKAKSPNIIFGDHTRIFKFVDFPFCLGADGVKVLRPKIEADTKFLFHYLSSVQIPEAGYSRHYKFLKRMTVILPPMEEQRRIAAILDQAEALRAKRRQALAKFDTLTQSLFLEMFGDPNQPSARWPSATLGDSVQMLQYGPRFYNESYVESGVRIVRITDLSSSGELDYSQMPRLDVSEADKQHFILKPGDIIFARTGATVGKVSCIRDYSPECIAGAYFIRLRFAPEKITPDYAYAVLGSPSVQEIIAKQSRQAAQQNFSGPGLRRLPLPLAPLSIQKEFSCGVRQLEDKRKAAKASADKLEQMCESLQHRAFRGEL